MALPTRSDLSPAAFFATVKSQLQSQSANSKAEPQHREWLQFVSATAKVRGASYVEAQPPRPSPVPNLTLLTTRSQELLKFLRRSTALSQQCRSFLTPHKQPSPLQAMHSPLAAVLTVRCEEVPLAIVLMGNADKALVSAQLVCKDTLVVAEASQASRMLAQGFALAQVLYCSACPSTSQHP